MLEYFILLVFHSFLPYFNFALETNMTIGKEVALCADTRDKDEATFFFSYLFISLRFLNYVGQQRNRMTGECQAMTTNEIGF